MTWHAICHSSLMTLWASSASCMMHAVTDAKGSDAMWLMWPVVPKGQQGELSKVTRWDRHRLTL